MAWTSMEVAKREGRGQPDTFAEMRICSESEMEEGAGLGEGAGWTSDESVEEDVEEDVALGWYPSLASRGQQGAPKAWLPPYRGVWEDLDCPGTCVDHGLAQGPKSSVTWGYQHPSHSTAERVKERNSRRARHSSSLVPPASLLLPRNSSRAGPYWVDL